MSYRICTDLLHDELIYLHSSLFIQLKINLFEKFEKPVYRQLWNQLADKITPNRNKDVIGQIFNDIFTNRCIGDPQGVIKDLLEQTTRQAVEINRLMSLTEAVLEPHEAKILIEKLDLTEEVLQKKLKLIMNSEKKKEKKKK